MKKVVLTSLFIIVSIVSLSAQTEYGLKSGFFKSVRETNLSFENDGLENVGNYNDGIYLGAFAEFNLFKKFGLRPEINYAFLKNDFDQLRIPVLGTYQVSKKFKVFLGPELGYLITNNENFKKPNIGITIGASYELIKNLSIEARYYHALTESLKDNFEGSFNSTAKFNSFQLGLVYNFGK